MNFEERLRGYARTLLPDGLRKPLGKICGVIRSHVLYPFMGLLFDLKGGCFRADGCSFVIPKDITSLAFRASFLMNTHEADERMLVRKFVRPHDAVLELGACLGILSCITNKLLRPPARHLVVEANPYCLPAIYRNRERNGASFLVENCAVSTKSEVSFSVNPAFITGSAVGEPSASSLRLAGRSLAELNTRYGPFSALIMDVEGSELELLEASVDVVRGFRLVIVELHEAAIGVAGVKRCREILKSCGFKLVEQSHISEAWSKDDHST